MKIVSSVPWFSQPLMSLRYIIKSRRYEDLSLKFLPILSSVPYKLSLINPYCVYYGIVSHVRTLMYMRDKTLVKIRLKVLFYATVCSNAEL